MSDVQDAAHIAIAELLQRIDPGVMVTGFVLTAEVIGSDGGHSVWTLTASDATVWSTLGLLRYAEACEVACIGDDE